MTTLSPSFLLAMQIANQPALRYGQIAAYLRNNFLHVHGPLNSSPVIYIDSPRYLLARGLPIGQPKQHVVASYCHIL